MELFYDDNVVSISWITYVYAMWTVWQHALFMSTMFLKFMDDVSF